MRCTVAKMRCAALVVLGTTAACAPAPAPVTAPAPSTSALAAPAVAAAPGDPATHGVFTADIDRSVAPCDDFYRFANGAWREANPIPASMQRWSRRWQAGEANKGRLRDILEDVSHSAQAAGSSEELAGDYYASCMDEARIDAAGATPIRKLLAEIDAMRTPADVARMVRTLHAIGVPALFAFGATPDAHDPRRTIGDVGAGGLGLPDRDYYLKTEPRFVAARAQYTAYLTRMLALAGKPEAEAARASGLAFDVEKRLALASLDNVALRDPKNTDHPATMTELQALSPHFGWAAYLDDAKVARASLNVSEPAFVKAVDRELASAPMAAWRAYFAARLVTSAAPWLSAPFASAHFQFFDHDLAGVAEMKPRWKRCAESTDKLLGEALGRVYVQRHFPPAAKARVSAMVGNILAAMRSTVEDLAWMSPETKRRALEKLATFNPKIGYPDHWKDYASVHVARDTFWANVVAARRFAQADDRALIGHPTDRARWAMTPPTADAQYNPTLNDLTFPAGILQPPAFDVNADDAVNYGAMGVAIGHEISHGFDDEGAQFDAAGRLESWWTPADLTAFQQRGACVSRQFSGYFIEPGIHHDGNLVLGESIGDLAGARIAFRALETALHTPAGGGVSPVARASHDGFTPEQEFFLSWGQFRGDATRPETQRMMVQGDPHPVAKFRVIGPLSNLPEFQKAFQCAEGTAMVRGPAERCDVW